MTNDVERNGPRGAMTGAVEPRHRALTLARIVALVVIGVLVVGLAYLRLAPGEASVVVPDGARAGDLTLEPCTYPTEDGSYAAECGTIVVPENRAEPGSRLIALPVTRIPAKSDHPAEPVFYLQGGPGLTNMVFPMASRFAQHRDVVQVGYRGVEGSSRLDCPEVASALKHSADFLGAESLDAYSDALASCAVRLQDAGVDLAGYTLPQRVDDFEAVRTALGYDRIDLISESVGTRTAMIYSWRYPHSIHRSVMIGVNPPGHFVWDPEATDEQIQHYAELCAEDAGCRERTDDLAATMRRTADDIPDRWLFLPIKDGNVRLESFFGLMESTPEARGGLLAAPATLDSWLSAADGDASGFWFASFLADFTFPESFVWGETAATAMLDAQVADAYYSAGGDPGSILGNPGTDFVWGGGGLADAWPADPSDDGFNQVQTAEVETLLIGGTLDISTPAQFATDELLPSLPNGHQVVLAELGHTTDFWTYQPEASSHLINTFFDSGDVDDSLYTHRTMDFGTDITLTALAKGIAAAMVGLAIIAVLSLLWMRRRVRKRGSFGPKASAALRSVYPLVLGLGGWFLAVLVVMTIRAPVALDSELLAVLSVGLPIGLGIYWAWVHRDWSATSKARGFWGAMAGALVGAWAGFNAPDGLLALITAIVGAAVGANLTLIALDISWDRSGRRRAVEGPTGRESMPSKEPGIERAST
jgi:pimeloyl-ACP methyl ester carboxylesterase